MGLAAEPEGDAKTTWGWILFAAATAYLIKLASYLLPQSVWDELGWTEQNDPDTH